MEKADKITELYRRQCIADVLHYLSRAMLTEKEKIEFLDNHIKWLIDKYPSYYK